MRRGTLVRLGIGTVVVGASVTGASGLALSNDADTIGSTLRFRVISTESRSDSYNKSKSAARAKVPLEQAVQVAKEKVPGTVVAAALTQKDLAVWDVDILSLEGRAVRISVDAATGAVYEGDQ